eukprot:1477493-Prymnesium_polylepis.1
MREAVHRRQLWVGDDLLARPYLGEAGLVKPLRIERARVRQPALEEGIERQSLIVPEGLVDEPWPAAPRRLPTVLVFRCRRLRRLVLVRLDH